MSRSLQRLVFKTPECAAFKFREELGGAPLTQTVTFEEKDESSFSLCAWQRIQGHSPETWERTIQKPFGWHAVLEAFHGISGGFLGGYPLELVEEDTEFEGWQTWFLKYRMEALPELWPVAEDIGESDTRSALDHLYRSFLSHYDDAWLRGFFTHLLRRMDPLSAAARLYRLFDRESDAAHQPARSFRQMLIAVNKSRQQRKERELAAEQARQAELLRQRQILRGECAKLLERVQNRELPFGEIIGELEKLEHSDREELIRQALQDAPQCEAEWGDVITHYCKTVLENGRQHRFYRGWPTNAMSQAMATLDKWRGLLGNVPPKDWR